MDKDRFYFHLEYNGCNGEKRENLPLATRLLAFFEGLVYGRALGQENFIIVLQVARNKQQNIKSTEFNSGMQ